MDDHEDEQPLRYNLRRRTTISIDSAAEDNEELGDSSPVISTSQSATDQASPSSTSVPTSPPSLLSPHAPSFHSGILTYVTTEDSSVVTRRHTSSDDQAPDSTVQQADLSPSATAVTSSPVISISQSAPEAATPTISSSRTTSSDILEDPGQQKADAESMLTTSTTYIPASSSAHHRPVSELQQDVIPLCATVSSSPMIYTSLSALKEQHRWSTQRVYLLHQHQ